MKYFKENEMNEIKLKKKKYAFPSYNEVNAELEKIQDGFNSCDYLFASKNKEYYLYLSTYCELENDPLIYECASNIYYHIHEKNFVRREIRKIYKSDDDLIKVKAMYYTLIWFAYPLFKNIIRE